MTEVMNNCKLGERKNCNLPGVKVDLPVLQEKDKNDLINFGIPNGVDFVAASFVQSAEDVKFIRQTLGLRGRSIKIISKIENEEGLKNFDAIVEESDVANAVLDGTDCVMLSGETAAGAFPLNAVTIMRQICEEAEAVVDYSSLYQSLRE